MMFLLTHAFKLYLWGAMCFYFIAIGLDIGAQILPEGTGSLKAMLAYALFGLCWPKIVWVGLTK